MAMKKCLKMKMYHEGIANAARTGGSCHNWLTLLLIKTSKKSTTLFSWYVQIHKNQKILECFLVARSTNFFCYISGNGQCKVNWHALARKWILLEFNYFMELEGYINTKWKISILPWSKFNGCCRQWHSQRRIYRKQHLGVGLALGTPSKKIYNIAQFCF